MTATVKASSAKGLKSRSKGRMGYVFIAPFMLVFATFYILPVLYAIYLSLLTKKRGVLGEVPHDVFSGLDNYIRAFQDSDFVKSIGNVLIFGLGQIPIMIGLALVLALVLDLYKGAALRFFRTAFYLPYTLPTIIAGLLWGYMYSPNLSPFNQMFKSWGWNTVDFFGPTMIYFSIGNIVTWTWTGYNMVTMYSSLQNIPRDIYEAATIDGATNLDIARFIKIPLLRPTIGLTFIFSVIGTSQIFSEPFVLKQIQYVPDNITPNLYLYLAASRDGNFSYAAAMAIIIALITFGFSLIFLRFANFGERE